MDVESCIILLTLRSKKGLLNGLKSILFLFHPIASWLVRYSNCNGKYVSLFRLPSSYTYCRVIPSEILDTATNTFYFEQIA